MCDREQQKQQHATVENKYMLEYIVLMNTESSSGWMKSEESGSRSVLRAFESSMYMVMNVKIDA